jgi:hypothetical protein
LFTLTVALTAWTGLALAAPEIGSAAIVVKTVRGAVEDRFRTLVVRDNVHQNEHIQTARGSASEFVFLDGSKLSLGPDTLITLDRFVYHPDRGAGTFVMNIVEGAFRFATGQISKLGGANYEIHTPTTVMSISGTRLSGVIAPDGTTAAILDSDSLISVTGRAGQTVNLDASGFATVVGRDGMLAPVGVAPRWARDRLRELDILLAGRHAPSDPNRRQADAHSSAGSAPGPSLASPPGRSKAVAAQTGESARDDTGLVDNPQAMTSEDRDLDRSYCWARLCGEGDHSRPDRGVTAGRPDPSLADNGVVGATRGGATRGGGNGGGGNGGGGNGGGGNGGGDDGG